MALVFNMGSQARLAEGIEDTDTRILLTSYDTMLSKGGSGDSYYALMINVEGDLEIVLVDVGSSDVVEGLSVTRGVEATAARDWGAGTIIWQVLSKASVELIAQKAVFRQVAYVPDGVLVSDYFGEKVYQTDLHLWWKAVGAASTEWRLIAGEIFVEDIIYSPTPGSVPPYTPLTMTCGTPGVAIYYTTDGSDPDQTDTLYTAPVTIPDPGPTTFKTKAFGAERWQQPSVNITSGAYTVVTATNWSNKSMATQPFPHIIYSASNTSLLLLQGSQLLERIGYSWSQVAANYPGGGGDLGHHIIEDGSTIWMVGNNSGYHILLYTTVPAFPAWTAQYSSYLGDINTIYHVVKFGANIYLDIKSQNPSTFYHGLYLVSAVDTISLFSRYAAGVNDVSRISTPVEWGGSLYATVLNSGGWFGNLLRLDSGTATRLTTTNDLLYGLFVYNNQLHAFSPTAGTAIHIKRFDGVSAWTTIKTTNISGATGLGQTTVTVGNLFYNIEGVHSDLWRWYPAGDTLVKVAENITDDNTSYTNQPIAWDSLDAPATMWHVAGFTPNKTWRWE